MFQMNLSLVIQRCFGVWVSVHFRDFLQNTLLNVLLQFTDDSSAYQKLRQHLIIITTIWLLNLERNCYYNLQLNSYYNSWQNTRAKVVFLLIRPMDFFAFLVAFRRLQLHDFTFCLWNYKY